MSPTEISGEADPLPPPGEELPATYPETRSRRDRWIIATTVGCVSLISVPILALIVFGVLLEVGVFPDSKAVRGEKVEERLRPFLEQHGLLEDGERIIYYYSCGTFSYEEDGNYFTPQRVVSYWQDEERIDHEQARYDEIASIESELSTSILTDATITIERHDGSMFDLYVSSEDDGDDLFLERLQQEWEQKR